MLIIENLSKSFDQQTQVLKGLSLRIEEGESVAIMGPSGCGKSTFLNIVAGLESADSGDITFSNLSSQGPTANKAKGADANAMSPSKYWSQLRREKLGIVFQRFNLIEHLSVEENIFLPAQHKRNLDKPYLERLIEKLGIAECRSRYPAQISGGQQQRVAIARGLAHKPDLILADEPTGNLDPATAKVVGDLLFDVVKTFETSLLLVTHSIELAQRADRILYIDSGHLSSAQKSAESISV